jgi:hypothetical protein
MPAVSLASAAVRAGVGTRTSSSTVFSKVWRRRAPVFSVCEQVDVGEMGFALEAMSMPLEALGYQIAGQLPVTGVFERGAVNRHDDIMGAAFEDGRRFGPGMFSEG